MWREKRLVCGMLVSEVGAIMGQRERNPLGFPPLPLRVIGLRVPWPPWTLFSLQVKKMLEKRGGEGKGNMKGTLCPLTALGSC